jgi:hypothetical protein
VYPESFSRSRVGKFVMYCVNIENFVLIKIHFYSNKKIKNGQKRWQGGLPRGKSKKFYAFLFNSFFIGK